MEFVVGVVRHRGAVDLTDQSACLLNQPNDE